MKKQMLIASWACFALTTPLAYAIDENIDNNSQKDTIIFSPTETTKILFIGDDMSDMVKFNRLDSLKWMLIEDVKKAQKQSGYPVAPKTTHYFVGVDGKRRLKTESEDFLEPEVNVEKEKQSMTLNLPTYVFIIHDLANQYDCNIYVKDPADLPKLSNESFSEALALIAHDKEIQKHYFSVDLEKESSQWKVKDKRRNRQDMIELSPTFGLGLIGSQWSPSIGANISLLFTNKYSTPVWKTELGLSAYSFTSSNLADLSSISLVQSYSFRFLGNLSFDEPENSKTKWFGLEGGWFNAPSGSPFNGAYQIGIHTEGIGPFNFSFDVIRTKNNKSLYGVTLTIPF